MVARTGENHHGAKLTDMDVERVRRLNERGVCYRIIAEAWEAPLQTIAAICQFKRRTESIEKYQK